MGRRRHPPPLSRQGPEPVLVKTGALTPLQRLPGREVPGLARLQQQPDGLQQPGRLVQGLGRELKGQPKRLPLLHQAATSMRLVAMTVTFSATMEPTLPSS